MDRKMIRRALGIFLVFLGLGAAVFFKAELENTVQDGYLLREDYGGSAYETVLEAETESGKQEIRIKVPAREYSTGETEAFLDEAEKGLKKLILGDLSEDCVDENLVLPASYPDLPVKLSWFSEDPLYLTSEGKLTGQIPSEGVKVRLMAELSCQKEERQVEMSLCLFPRQKSEEEELEEAVNHILSSEDASDERLYLPERVGNTAVSWSREDGKGKLAFFVVGLGAVAALGYLWRQKKKPGEEQKIRYEKMMRDYPSVISKLLLLLEAGLSMRNAFFRMAEDYQRQYAEDGIRREGYEVIEKCCRDIAHGIPEEEAYQRLGEEAPPPYRTFSVLVIQNLRLGGREMSLVLRREAENAFEERKKRARILGEQASSKLLFPMMGLLVIVFIILMVPAFVSVG